MSDAVLTISCGVSFDSLGKLVRPPHRAQWWLTYREIDDWIRLMRYLFAELGWMGV